MARSRQLEPGSHSAHPSEPLGPSIRATRPIHQFQPHPSLASLASSTVVRAGQGQDPPAWLPAAAWFAPPHAVAQTHGCNGTGGNKAPAMHAPPLRRPGLGR